LFALKANDYTEQDVNEVIKDILEEEKDFIMFTTDFFLCG